jgi:hypothetical protein
MFQSMVDFLYCWGSVVRQNIITVGVEEQSYLMAGRKQKGNTRRCQDKT